MLHESIKKLYMKLPDGMEHLQEMSFLNNTVGKASASSSSSGDTGRERTPAQYKHDDDVLIHRQLLSGSATLRDQPLDELNTSVNELNTSYDQLNGSSRNAFG